MRRDDASFLLDMLVAARDAADFADGLPYDARPANRRIVHSREFVPCHGAGEVTEPNSTAPSSCAPCSSSRPVAISQTVARTANGSGSFAAAPSRGGLDRSEAALQHAAPKERKK